MSRIGACPPRGTRWRPACPGCRARQCHGLFTTEILNDAADTLERFDQYRSDGDDGVPLSSEPPSLDDRIVSQSAVFSIMTDPEASLSDWLADHPALFRKV
jgi:hypothetical protein